MKRRQFIAGAALASAAVAANLIGDAEKVPDYTFYDDFDGTAGSAPDPTKWTYDLGGGGWGNKELETYTNSRINSYIDGNSNLVLAATKTVSGAVIAYQSARLKTQGLFSQVGGHFEGRMKFASQPGIWPAFWLLGQNIGTVGWPECSEIDIYENFGYTSEFSSSVYAQNTGNDTYKYGATIAGDGDWHTHRCDIDEEGISFFLDGYEYGHVAAANYCPPAAWKFGPGEPNNGGMFFVLNIAVGGIASQNPPPATNWWPANVLVDWVRAWA